MHALFVFAHQDDEIAAAARIAYLVRSGATISCVFLTNGEGRSATAAQRDEESRRVLARLRVDLRRVHFAGSEERIPDGALVEHLDRAYALLASRVTEPVDEVWCLAWEGGHQDHDASHLVAVAFAMEHGAQCFELPLYHGHRMRGPFFQTLAPLRIGGEWVGRRVPLGEALRLLALCRFYRSQRKTWLGLLPGAFLRLVLGQREWTRIVDPSRLDAKPHDGVLFYERRFGFPWDRFERHARPFIARACAPRRADRDRPTPAGSR
ncbi:MAG TPA: PIG-L family deacetylase [Thermoanaerobaculia bacterium]|jgi:LmbE family N-acetylglucosaminyl deacetylase|nr:PIG-L family deacetylase [Thermoanaerobaculia bacterium]